MLDTLKLRSPYIPDDLARMVESSLQRRSCVDLGSGEIIWEFVTGELDGSFDHRVSVKVERTEHIAVDRSRLIDLNPLPLGQFREAGKRASYDLEVSTVPKRVPSDPYLVVEGSVHKAMLGHNVEGGPESIQAAARWFVNALARRLDVELPAADLWTFRRIDWAECFDLGGSPAVAEYISYLHNAKFPRRKTVRYENEAIVIPGTTSTDKLYHKGPEFTKHDRTRLRRFLPEASVAGLQARANMILRAEVEVHAKTLDAWSTGNPVVASVEIGQQVRALFSRDMARTLREGASEMQVVRTAAAVERRLFDLYSGPQAYALLGTWSLLSARGEEVVKRAFANRRSTYYDHRKKLLDAGCSWHDGDVKLDQRVRLVPEDFTPQIGDPRRVTGEAPEVAAALEEYRRAS